MRRTDPDTYCPQAALISQETIRRTEERLAKYREKHYKAKEAMMRQQQTKLLLGHAMMLAVIGAVWLWRRNNSAKSKTNNDDADDHSDSNDTLQVEFEGAANTVKSFPNGFLDSRDQLMLYGLYKQAMFGDCIGDMVSYTPLDK
jgi:hypothetical protein